MNGSFTEGKDGIYRWIYELNLLKNPVVLFVILKIFGALMAISFAFMLIFNAGSSGFWWAGFLAQLKGYGIAVAVMLAVSLLGYLLYAAIMGGKYIVLFEMGEKGIRHTQIRSQALKAQKLGGLTAAAGLLSGNLTTAGIGLMSGARTSMTSDFDKVRSIKVLRAMNTIKVNEPFGKNQVYADKEHFDFVLNYITERCVNVKHKRKTSSDLTVK